jgi:hypothetical protein
MAALGAVPPHAVLLIEGTHGYPPIYASLIEGVRPDVLVVDQFLRIRGDGWGYGPELERLRRTPGIDPEVFDLHVTGIVASGPRPLFLEPGAPDLDWTSLGLTRLRGGAVDRLIRGNPSQRIPSVPAHESMTPVTFGEVATLVSSNIGPVRIEEGDAMKIELDWERLPLAESGPVTRTSAPTVYVVAGDEAGHRLEDGEGRPLLDHARPLGQGVDLDLYSAGDVFRETTRLVVPRDLPTDRITLWLAVLDGDRFISTAGGTVFTRLGEIQVEARQRGLWSLPGESLR